MTLDPDCVSVRIDNSTTSANRRPKIRLVVRSVLNSEVCTVYFCCCCCCFSKCLEPRTTCWDVEYKLSFYFYSFRRWSFCYKHFVLSRYRKKKFWTSSVMNIVTYIEGWLLLYVDLELLNVWIIIQLHFCLSRLFFYIKMSYLNYQSLCSWRERKLSRTQIFGKVSYMLFYLITLDNSK